MRLTDLRQLHRHNVATLRRQPLAEISGALGDLGTLLPLMIALAAQGSIDLSATLVFSGVFNILTGLLFGIPLPVQPMKAIASAAIASHTSQAVTTAAGTWVAIAVLFLTITGLLRLLTVWTPLPVVKGIQLGAGLSLVISAGGSLLRPLPWFATSSPDSLLLALLAFLLLVLTSRLPRFPYALAATTLGLVLAAATLALAGRGADLPALRPWRPRLGVPLLASPKAASMALAQLPLTTLNSVVAAAALARDLAGPRGLPAPGVAALGLSVAAMNLAGAWAGAMPVCHGAGGLAAQWRFGARSGASVALLGLLKLALGLAFGRSLVGLLRAFPGALLGVMVFAAGLELAKVGESINSTAGDLWEESVDRGGAGGGVDRVVKKARVLGEEEKVERWTVMMVTVGGVLAFRNDGVGFLMGIATHLAYRLSHGIERRRQRRRGERQPLLA